MPLAPVGIFDLSSITDELIRRLTTCKDQSSLWNPGNLAPNPGPPFTIDVSGSAPEVVRSEGDCQLSLYLFHVARDKYRQNAEPAGRIDPTVPPVRYVPLALDLYYLLTAFSKVSYVEEQRAMTVAMRCFHDNPIIRLNVSFGAIVLVEEFTLTMESESSDELARLWQAFAVPPRLSAVYKVSVVLISPETHIGPPRPKPTHVSITADTALLPFSATGQVIGTSRTYRFRHRDGTLSEPVEMSPATAIPNQPFFLYGVKLGLPTSDHVYLTMPGNVNVDVTAWLTGPPSTQTESRFTLTLPNAFGAPPAQAPPPGIYQLSVGNAAGSRSNKTPFSIGPRIDVAPGAPILAGPVFTVDGIGFTPGQTEVLLDTVPLTPGAAAAGFFQVNGAGTQITLQAPPNFPAGHHAVRVRVNGVEADPSWWIQVP